MPTARPSALGSFEFSAESAFCEATATVATRMILRQDSIDVSSLQRELVDRGGVFQRMGEGDNSVPGAFGVSTFSTTFDLYGHGGTAADSLTATNLATLLGHAIGGVDTGDNGGVDAGTGSVTELNPDGGSEDFADGALVRVGALGDARGGGQFYAVGSTTGTPNTAVTLLTAMAGAANDGDVIYASQMIYPLVEASSSDIVSSGAGSNNTLRIRLQTANYQFLCRGCVAQSVEFAGLSSGEMPQVTITWATAHWEHVADTFPDATATSDYAPAPVANGSLFYQAKGTTTRATLTPRNFSLTIGHSVQPIMGPGGTQTAQDVIGWVRTPAMTTLSFAVEAEAATATPTYHDYFVTDPNSIVNKHILYTLSAVDGRAIGLYLPNCAPQGSAPTQTSIDSLNYVELTFVALTNTTTTTELEASPWRLAMA